MLHVPAVVAHAAELVLLAVVVLLMLLCVGMDVILLLRCI
jgi:hypothetical protein